VRLRHVLHGEWEDAVLTLVTPVSSLPAATVEPSELLMTICVPGTMSLYTSVP